MKEEKKSIIKDALIDYNTITEAAKINAAKILAEQFPEKFNSLLKEELNKNNTIKKESYKKIDNDKSENLDESKTKKENIMSESKKEATKNAKSKVNEERDKDFMGDVEGNTPNLGKGESNDGDAFTEKSKKNTDHKVDENSKKENIKEDFDISDLEIDDVDSALDTASPDDEIVTMEEIEREIAEMEDLKSELDTEEESEPYSHLGPLKNKLQEMMNEIDKMQEMHSGEFDLEKMHKGEYDDELIDEKYHDMDEQKNHGGKQNFKGRENGGPTNQMIDEENNDMYEGKRGPKKGADYDEEQGKKRGEQDTGPDEYEEVDEAMGIAHSSSKHVAGDHLPGEDFAKHRHKRYGSFNNSTNEAENKKLTSLLNENKKLTKKLNESKKYKETVDKLVENYKTVLGKYRNQLKEMAIFNTNLSHVNNLFVNETLALTQDDKIKIIKEFKEVNTINESKKKYDSMLNEMKTNKKNNISESVEEKVTNSVQSSSRKLDEVVEKTAYKNDNHINRIKRLIEYTENRGKNNKELLKN